MKKTFINIICSTSIVLASHHNVFASDTYKGDWYTEDKKGVVRLELCEETPQKWCGKIISLKDPLGKDGKPLKDVKNSNEKLRSRPVVGINLVWGFIKKDGDLVDGNIYNPEDGNTYSSEITQLNKNQLKVSGCFLKFLCKKQVWNRK